MALLPGARIGLYEIVSPIGAGGMGEVYRARDAKLKRDVAIKVLPADVAGDRERLARFQREAEVLASLNHPHIAQVYGLEQFETRLALVMELVEGEDLSQLIAQGALPLDEALAIAKQIAEALEAAHEAGIVHRDLKPANIKVREDGTVKVLDFGLAKGSGSRDQGSGDLANSPTITSPAMTMRGVILGTAAYMAPEQAKGKAVDRRADIWAFGCVLYEMLTGTRAFKGDDVTDIITSVLRDSPDWNPLPAGTPAAIQTLLRRCLDKDPRQRTPHIAVARLALEDARTAGSGDGTGPAVSAGGLSYAAAAAIAVAGMGLAAVGVWTLRAPATTTPALVSRFDITPPPGSAVVATGNTRDIAISRDGRRIAYVGGNGASLFVRDLDRVEPVRVFDSGFPSLPFFSVDGKWVGFTDGLDSIKRVPVGGGAVELITRIAQPAVQATAGPGNVVVYGTVGGLWRVPLEGGESTLLAAPDLEQGELSFSGPEFLPGPRPAVLFVISGKTNRIGVLDLSTGEKHILVEDAIAAKYVSSGHLVYWRDRTIRAIGFDLARLTTVGEPVPLAEPILITTFGNGTQFDIADDGTLVFLPADAPVAARRVVWVERDGREQPAPLPVRAYTYVAMASNGAQAAFDIRDQENDIWVWDIARGPLRRLTFGRTFEQSPRWSSDSSRVFFNQGAAIIAQRADGAGRPETAFTNPVHSNGGTLLNSVTPDATSVVFRGNVLETGYDVQLGSLRDGTVQPLLQTRANELNAEVSPDGRWVAYESDESGTYEVYVRPFPDATSGRWQVSNSGGRKPLWARNGGELFFVSGDGAMMAAPVESRGTFSAGTPARLFKGDYYFGSAASIGRTFDVTPDGRRFLMIQEDRTRPTSISVVQNWTEEVKRLVPPGGQR